MFQKNQTDRYVSYNDDELSEFSLLKTSKSTDSATKVAMNLLNSFCEETVQNRDFEKMELSGIDKILQRFFAGIRKHIGEMYKVNSLGYNKTFI